MSLDKNCVVVAPLSITNAMLTLGPPDAENQVYDAGTTYATGDEVWYNGKVFRSKVDSNTGNTPVEGANWADLGEVDEGALAWAAGTTYAEGDYAVKDGLLWRSTASSNTGNPPTATATQWQSYGPTNRLKPFDLFLNRSAVQPGSLTYTIQFTSRINSLMILTPFGGSVNITGVVDSTEVYNKDVSIVAPTGGGPYRYFFLPFERKNAIVLDDLPAFRNMALTVTITGGTARVAQIVAGFGESAGTVVTGSGVGFESFARVEFDAFGNPTIPDRPQQRITGFAIRNAIRDSGRLNRVLAARVQRPTGCFMRDGEEWGLVSFGVMKAFYTTFSNPTLAEYMIEIDGFAEGDAL